VITGVVPDSELVAELAELDARAAAKALDQPTTWQVLLRLQEDRLREQIRTAKGEELKVLQGRLADVRDTIANPERLPFTAAERDPR
jgi:hypothetical protein